MPFMGRRDLSITLTFMHPHLPIHSFIHSELRETWYKRAPSWKQCPKKKSSANIGTGTRTMWWELWKKTYDVMFLGTLQIALYLPVSGVSKEMQEHSCGFGNFPQKWFDNMGDMFGLLQGYNFFYISGSSAIFTWSSSCLLAYYNRVTEEEEAT